MPTQMRRPVTVEAALDEPLSGWLWLVKWLLLIPHYFVLAFLWIAFVILTIIAFFAILFTGRYPRGIFDFNVGVFRWTWRVWYYGYGALATDRYPPFTLDDVPDYPARIEIAYPERLSRGLVLVKWWLLVFPQYLIVGVFTDSVTWGYGRYGGGLVTLVALIAAIGVLFTRNYLPGLYDFVVGMNRWALRVAVYAALMTDAYPPFRMDLGGPEPPAPIIPDATDVPGAPGSPGAAAGGHGGPEGPDDPVHRADPAEG